MVCDVSRKLGQRVDISTDNEWFDQRSKTGVRFPWAKNKMVVKKSDVLSDDNNLVQQAVVEFEQIADAGLQRDGHYTLLLESQPRRFRTPIASKLRQLYVAAGWQVEVSSSTDWYNVKIS